MRLPTLLLVLLAAARAAAPDDWIVFPAPGASPRDQLKRQLNEEGFRHLDARQRAVAALRTRAEAEARQREVREKILRLLGGLPTERTPLNTRHLGTEERDGYRYDRVIFESLPGFHIPANVYRPARGDGPFPAILMPVGHSPEGKEGERTTAIGLARKGFVVLKYDPIGQGERLQYYDPDLRASRVGATTAEHSHANGHTVLIGDNVARYRVWDGIRGLDYLVSRPDVDPRRLGVTGCSGGGTLTTYIAALDPRVAAAAPSCYITTWRALLERLGPQDGEQSFAHFLSEGLDIPDYIALFAPKPYLIASTRDDFFPLDGAKAAYEEARRFHGLFGAAEHVHHFVGPGPHGMPRESREAVYAFFLKYLQGGAGDATEAPVVLDPLEKILCTPTGQVADSFQSENVFTLNRKRAQGVMAKVSAAELPAAVRRLAGITARPGDTPAAATVHRSWQREGHRADLLSLRLPDGAVLTGTLLVPAGPGPHRPLILLDARPKDVVAAPGGDAESLVRRGWLVLALQPRGTRERPAGPNPGLVGDFDLAFHAHVVGRSLTGLRTEDVFRAADFLLARKDVDPQALTAVGQGASGVYVLHAAALDPRIRRVVTQQSPALLRLGVDRPIHQHIFEVAVPGMLRAYDLDDLLRAIAPRPVAVVNPVDLLEKPLHTPWYRDLVKAPGEVLLRGRRDALPGLP